MVGWTKSIVAAMVVIFTTPTAGAHLMTKYELGVKTNNPVLSTLALCQILVAASESI